MNKKSLRHARVMAWVVAAALSACGGGGGDDTANTDVGAVPQGTGRAHALTAGSMVASQWSARIPLTLIPAAAANLPNGKLMLWAAQDRLNFTVTPGSTYTTVFDPVTQTAAEHLVTETTHNMFCPGTTNLPDGRLLVNGGSSSGATSLYDPVTNTWNAAQPMNIPRAYQANTLLADGSVLTLGGSWNGGRGNKHAEVWTAAGGWRRLTGVPVDPMVGPDPTGPYRGDNHMWLIPAGNGRVLHAGPSAAMNWIDTRGDGATAPAGPRGDDTYSINGSAVMYDIGKVLKTGGAPAYEQVEATNSVHLLDLRGGTASVRRLAPMNYQRAFHNSVVLPNGQVLILGGQTRPMPFVDSNSVLVPELWDPATETFTMQPAMEVARNYHSSALLLPDARVASIGGGLCGTGCSGNHPDLQIFTPRYLLNAEGGLATRPVIASAPAEAAYGSHFTLGTDSPVTAFALVRLSSATHGVNNDQRRIPLQFSAAGPNQYVLSVPENPGIALPGFYMLFALNADGVPSVAKTLRIGGEMTPQLQSLGDPLSVAGLGLATQLIASGPGTISFSATGLPPGLSLDGGSGAITGTPSTPGTYSVTIRAINAEGAVSTDLLWTVQPPGMVQTRFVKLEALSEVGGHAWTSIAEFNLLDTQGNVLPRTGWVATADSQETAGEAAPATAAIDGAPGTYWHTQWSGASPPPPHSLVIDRGDGPEIGGFRMLPRQNGPNGRIATWRFHVSADGVNWRVVAQGNFANTAAEKTVFPVDTRLVNHWPTLARPANPTLRAGDTVSVSLSASDVDADTLSYAISNLPPGLTVNASTGAVSGTPTATGVFDATALVSDGRGGTATTPITWTVLARQMTIAPVPAAPKAEGSPVTYHATADAGVGATYQWDFGDGSPAVLTADATHTYGTAGLYSVTLTVTDSTGHAQARTFRQAVYSSAPVAAGAAQSSSVVFGKSVAGSRVWVVNEDSDSVSLFDAATLAKLGQVAVGGAPRSAALAPDGRLWVANKGSATVSVVDPDTLAVARTIPLPRASMPYGVVFAPDGGSVYVSLEATGQVLKLDPIGGVLQATLDVGPNPRHLAVTPGGERLLVSRFISPPLPGESTANVQTVDGDGRPRGGEVVVVTSAPFRVERTVVLRVSQKPDSTAQGRGLPNYLAAAAVSPDGASAWVPGKQDNVQRGALRDGLNLDFQNSVRAISSRIDLASLTEDHAARIDHDNAGVASAAVFHPTGAYLFVALQTSRQVAVIDPVRGVEVSRFDAGRAPSGLAVSADGLRLFVGNLMDRTLQVFDLTRLVNYGESSVTSLAALPTQSAEVLSPQVLLGKQLFYDARDPRLARDGYLSCASCHDDGGHDGRVWDFTGMGEGLRNTISLRGRAGGQGFRHWSANIDETQDFEAQIRTLAQGTGLMSDELFNAGTRSQPLGQAKAGLSPDLDALAAYLGSLDSAAPSPLRQADGNMTPAAATTGKWTFMAQCASCHGGAGFTDSGTAILHDVGTLKPSSGKRLGAPLAGIDTPTLRDAWATAPYLHDGSAATLDQAIAAHTAITLSAADLAGVTAYVQQLGGEEPGPQVARYVRLQALSEVNGKPWTSMAEFNLLDPMGAVMPRTGWVAGADSQELQMQNGAAANALDGKFGSMWHTLWSSANPLPPHDFTVDLGAVRAISGFKYLPRTDGSTNGRIANWRFFSSMDGARWTPLAQGTFANTTAEKTVMFAP